MGPPRGLLIHLLLESAPVPAPLQPHDPAEAGRPEVAGGDQDLLALQALDQRAPRLAREVGIHVGPRDPVGLLDLHRVVRGVAEDERALAARGDQDAHVPGRVARRGHGRDGARDARLAVHELHEAEVGERPHAGRRVGIARRLMLGRVAGLPVFRAHPVTRFRKRRHPAAAGVGEVPADVIAVQVRHHDHVDLVDPHALRLEVLQQRAPRHVRRLLRARAEARVDENRAPVGADQVGAEVEADVVIVQVRLVGAPALLGNRREEVAEVELERAVGEGHDLDVADANDVVGHVGRKRTTRCYTTGGPPIPHREESMSKVPALMIAALLAGLAAVPPALAQTTTLTMSSWVSPQHHLTANVLQGWATEVEKATNGRVKFTMLPKHPSAPPGTFDAVRDGLVDLSFVTASYTPARHILPLLAELPGSGDTALVNSVAYSRVYWKHFDKVGEYKGVKLLGVFTHGPGQMFTKKPVKSIADVQGLKIRTGGGIAEQVAKALGASAFVKPAPESYELLSSGVADGVFFPMESIISFKLDTVLEQATLFPGGMYSSSFGFFMNEDKWNKLPRQDQEAIEKISGEHIARLAGASWDEADRKGMEQLKKSGVKIVNADPEFVAEVRKRSAPIVEDWITKAKAKGVDAAKVLAEFREELKKVAAGK